MSKFIREHSLTITAVSIWFGLVIASYMFHDEDLYTWIGDRAGGHADDAFGMLLIVLLTKWFVERGSKESK